MNHSRLVAVPLIAVALLVVMAAIRSPAPPVAADGDAPGFGVAAHGETFGPTVRRPLRVIDTSTGDVPAPPAECRWIPAHSDVGIARRSPGGCAVEVYFDPERTRRSRFELDPWMGIDVVVTRQGERIAFASTRVRFVD